METAEDIAYLKKERLFGGAFSFYYAPEPVYIEEPVCRLVREQYWDGYGWQFRPVQICN